MRKTERKEEVTHETRRITSWCLHLRSGGTLSWGVLQCTQSIPEKGTRAHGYMYSVCRPVCMVAAVGLWGELQEKKKSGQFIKPKFQNFRSLEKNLIINKKQRNLTF